MGAPASAGGGVRGRRPRQKMMAAIVGTVGLVLVAWLAAVGVLALQEQRILFQPSRLLRAEPSDFGLPAEELWVTTRDGVVLHGWWINSSSEAVVVWYHGNAGNIADRLDNARWFVDTLDVGIVLVDYRGYGQSDGTPSEAGVYLDGLAIYDEVRQRGVGADDVVLFGRSLGAAVALEVASERSARAVVLEAAFSSVPALARSHYWFVPRAAVRTRMDNVSKIGALDLPMLLLHGDRDAVVPLDHARRLRAAAGDRVRLHVIAGAGHNDTYLVGGEPYDEAWRAFLNDVDGATGPATEPQAR